MQLDQSPDTGDEPVVAHWRNGEMLHVDGIVLASGRVVLVDSTRVLADGKTEYYISPFADTWVRSILDYNPDCWVEFTTTETTPVAAGIHACCGEGAMGNEGFVALIDEESNRPLWYLFSTRSNPFEDLRVAEGSILVCDGRDLTWSIPCDQPERFRATPPR